MSPKSRGRPKGRGRPQKRRQSPVHERRVSDELMTSAIGLIAHTDPLDVECWASAWLGRAWAEAPMSERAPEHALCLEVAGRAGSRPSPSGLAAVAALLRVAPESEQSLLRGMIELLAERHPLPRWHDAPAPEPVAAWRAVDVWDSEHALLVGFDGPTPHTLMGVVNHVGGVMVNTLALLRTDVTDLWATLWEDDSPPMPLVEAPPDDVLAELAASLRLMDMSWPRQDDEDVVQLRALAWARCRSHLQPWPDVPHLDDDERAELLETFRALPEVKALTAPEDSIAYVSTLCLDYGEGYIHSGYLAWSPGHVGMFLGDWLPRKASLDADDRAALPDVLRAWLRFTLRLRGVSEEWITPVVEAVDEFTPVFAEAFDDTATWGPAKQVMARLEEMGVDPGDPVAVEDGLRAVNAENLARRLLDE